MANNVSTFYQTLVAAFNDAAATLVGKTKFLESVFKDIDSKAASIGQTINIALPASSTSNVSDLGVGDFTLNDISAGTASVVFNKHPGGAFIIRSFEQYNSPEQIRTGFLDSLIKGVAESINADIASLVTAANFNQYPTIGSSTPGIIDKASMTLAMGYLGQGKIPVNDVGNFFLFANPFAYYQMTGDQFWTANTQIGDVKAGSIRTMAQLGQQFGADTDFDQQMPVTDAVQAGTVAVTNGSAAVVGTSTTFTSLTAGQFILLDASGVPYQVKSVTDATHLTLQTPFIGTTASGSAWKERTFTNFVFHRHAIAMGVRPLPEPDGRVVDYSYVDYKGIPLRVQLGWSQLKNGWCVTVDAGYGRTVMRPDHGLIITS